MVTLLHDRVPTLEKIERNENTTERLVGQLQAGLTFAQ